MLWVAVICWFVVMTVTEVTIRRFKEVRHIKYMARAEKQRRREFYRLYRAS